VRTASTGPAPASRLFFRAAIEHGLPDDDEIPAILQDPRIDWPSLATLLVGSGLARPLLTTLTSPAIVRHAPAAFRDGLLQCGMTDVVRERAQREVIARIDEALQRLGGQGVLLKGTALLLRTPAGAVPRATGDIDVYVDARLASRLRSDLLAHGFDGDPHAGQSASHHLAPIARAGVDVEIHTRIMDAAWGLPEQAMLDDAGAIEGTAALLTLRAEGIAVHALTHATASFFSFGLKTGWDLNAALQSDPPFDWDRFARLAAATRLATAAWVPLSVLADGLSLPVRPDVLDRARREASLAAPVLALARDRLFDATEGIYELDALSKTAFMLLLHPRWIERLGYLRRAVGFRAARPDTWGAAADRASRAGMLRQAWRHYRRYREIRETVGGTGKSQVRSRKPEARSHKP
jgi:hypothetical protein